MEGTRDNWSLGLVIEEHIMRGLGVNLRGLMTTAAVAVVFLTIGGQTA